MTTKEQAYADRIEMLCVELLSIAEHYFGDDVIGTGMQNKFSGNRNVKRIAVQIAILNNTFQALSDIAGIGLQQCEAGAASIAEGGIAAPMALSMPKTEAESFRRSILRGLFNAIRVRMPNKTMQSLRLGTLWFRSKDDPPRIDTPEIPA